MLEEKKRIRKKFLNFCKTFSRVRKAIEIKNRSEIIIDAVIQQLEFVYELSWKLLKPFLEYNKNDYNFWFECKKKLKI